MQVRVFPDAEALAAGAAELIAEMLAALPGERVNLALTGGTNPKAAYRHLLGLPVDWARVDVWLSDERWVPKDHPDSNGRQVLEILLHDLPARFHRPRWAPWMTADDSAAHYEAELREIFPNGSPDLVMLGMGKDGHVASLFPDTEAIEEDRRWFVANWVSTLQCWRLTATYKLLHAARHLVFLVSGESKAATLAEVLEGEADLPARHAAAGAAQAIWLVDQAAAAQLRTVR